MVIKKNLLKLFSILLCTNIFLSLLGCAPKNTDKNIAVSWLNTDGSLIETTYIATNNDFELRELPSDTNHWHYTDWQILHSHNSIVCIAQRVEKINIHGKITMVLS